MRRYLKGIGVFVLFLFFASQAAFAQEVTGTIQGTVLDPTGAAVPGATVELTSVLVPLVKVTTDSVGMYRFPNLAPGRYTLTVTMTGFKTWKRENIDLPLGKTLMIEVKLEVGAVTESVVVTEAAAMIAPTEAKSTINIAAALFERLPKGRSFDGVMDLAAGTRYEPGQAGYQIEGASASENLFVVDGIDTTSIQTGVNRKDQPIEHVAEVQVHSTGFEAQYGGAMGGVVNVVTKSGGNEFHGEGLLYYSGSPLSASRNPYLRLAPGIEQPYPPTPTPPGLAELFQPGKDDYRTWEFGFSLGGYLIKDKIFFYTSYLPRLYDLNRTITWGAPYNVTKTFGRTSSTHYWLSRLSFDPTEKLRTSFSWNYSPYKRLGGLPSYEAVEDPTLAYQIQGYREPNSSYTATLDYMATNKLFLSARGGYWFANYHDWGTPYGDRYQWYASNMTTPPGELPVPDAYRHPRTWSNMLSNRAIQYDVQTRTAFSTDASYMAHGWGTHNLKAGYQMNMLHNSVTERYNTSRVMLYWYRTRSCITSQCLAFPPPRRGPFGYYINRDYGVYGSVNSFNHSIYFQDAWTVKRRLTFNLGMRLENEYLPSFKYDPRIPSKAIKFGWWDKVAPRIGVAWDVRGDGKMKAFASFGYFYDLMKYEMPRGSFGGDYWHDCVYTLDTYEYTTIRPIGGCPGAGPTPGRLIEEVDWRIPANDPADYTIEPNLKPMRQHEATVGTEWSFRPDWLISGRYVRKALDRTIEDVGVMTPAGEKYFIGNPGFGVTEFVLGPTYPRTPRAKRVYDGVEVRLDKRPGKYWFLNLSYTWSRLWGNYGGLTSSDEWGRHSPNVNRYFDLLYMSYDKNVKPTYGLLPTDRPHTLKVFSGYTLHWWGMATNFAGKFYAYSGTPRTREVYMVSSIPVYVDGRGKLGRTPAFTQTDFLVYHEIKPIKARENVRVRVEFNIVNLFNENNVLRQYDIYNRTEDNIAISDAAFFAGFDPDALIVAAGSRIDPRFGWPSQFQGPREIRFGVKFMF